MKKMLVSAAAIGFLAAGISFAAEHDHMQHETMMKQEGQKSDDRTELKIPAPMKTMQKKMMRQHMATLSEIAAALAANDLNKAAAAAKTNLGWNQEEEKKCSMIEKMTGEPDFTKLGKAVHQKADELADAAKAGNRDKALAAMAELINNCNACHNKFRH